MADIKVVCAEKYKGYYESICRCIEKEDNLINHRMSWALQVNATVVAFIFVNDKFLGGHLNLHSPNVFVIIGSLFGIFFTVISYLAIYSAIQQLEYLTDSLNFVSDKLDDGPYDVFMGRRPVGSTSNTIHAKSGLPRPFGEVSAIDFARIAPQAYCIAIIAVWVFALIRSF